MADRARPPQGVEAQADRRPVFSALTAKLSRLRPLDPAEEDALRSLRRSSQTFQPGSDLASEGQSRRPVFILESGWCYSYKFLPDGGRQVVMVKLPGDFLGVRSMLLRVSDHGFAPLTPVVASQVDMTELARLMRQSPRLAASLLWAAALDEAMIVEHLVSLGPRDAASRLAHFFLELKARLDLLGLVEGDSFDCPLSQQMIADLSGLTPIHVNRVLRRLREDQLMSFQRGRVVLHDPSALARLAGFDGSYLRQADHAPPAPDGWMDDA